MTHHEATCLIRSGAGTQFALDVVTAFEVLMADVDALAQAYPPGSFCLQRDGSPRTAWPVTAERTPPPAGRQRAAGT